MRFRTEVDIEPLGGRVEPGDRIFSIGSCFAENMAVKLLDSGFAVTSNPFGVLYNPASICLAFELIAGGHIIGTDCLVRNGDIWCSPWFHGRFSGTDRQEVLGRMNKALEDARRGFTEADVIIISLGTPWVYELSTDFPAKGTRFIPGMVAANCHKFPAAHYVRRRMEVDEICAGFDGLLSRGMAGKRVLFTVSPVRYVKDGLHGSNLGKAVLLLATERICERHGNATYFPAYEALVDDLRDYRFYGEDLIHPSPAAVEYIWELFRTHAMTPSAAEQAAEVEKLTEATRHRVHTPGSREHVRFLEYMLRRTDSLTERFPDAQLARHYNYFSNELAKYNDDGKE